MNIAKDWHWRWRETTQRCAPSAMPERTSGRNSGCTAASSYSACSTHVTCASPRQLAHYCRLSINVDYCATAGP
ncbi:hypothetical protein BHE74_00054817 [Ensete ventricosum]|nr:hypothetical protein GW17_00040480 [Ensete ventricosum]RWW39814.1 hypothetical protein BHE74_00054817 [Ensete ventricosum]